LKKEENKPPLRLGSKTYLEENENIQMFSLKNQRNTKPPETLKKNSYEEHQAKALQKRKNQ